MASTANSRAHQQVSDTVRYMRNPVETLGPSAYQGPIPRIRTQKQQEHKPLRRFDTFGENAIETIYDEFRFLDEPDAPSPASSGQTILKDGKRRRRRSSSLIAYSVLSILQLICSASLLILAVFRFWSTYKPRTATVDFNHPEGLDLLQPEGLRLLSQHSSSSVFLPAFFQLIAATFGLWPLAKNSHRPMQVLQLIFSLLAVLLWLRVVEIVSIEINVSFVQLHFGGDDSSLLLYTLALAAASFETIVLPSLSVVMIGHQLLGNRRHSRAFCSISLSIGTALIAAAAVCFSSFATSRTLSLLAAPPNGSRQSVFFSFGLRELIHSGYILLCAVFSFFAALHGDVGLSVAAAALQLMSILSLSTSLLNGSRLSAVVANSSLLSANGGPIAFPNVVLLYGLLGALLLLLTFQLVATLFSVRDKEKPGKPPPAASGERTSF